MQPRAIALVLVIGVGLTIGPAHPKAQAGPPRHATLPAVSPDGRQLAMATLSASGLGGELWIVNVDGSGRRQLTGGSYDTQPEWSPDGSWVLFVAGEHYDCHPHVIKADGTGLKKLASRNGYDRTETFCAPLLTLARLLILKGIGWLDELLRQIPHITAANTGCDANNGSKYCAADILAKGQRESANPKADTDKRKTHPSKTQHE